MHNKSAAKLQKISHIRKRVRVFIVKSTKRACPQSMPSINLLFHGITPLVRQ